MWQKAALGGVYSPEQSPWPGGGGGMGYSSSLSEGKQSQPHSKRMEWMTREVTGEKEERECWKDSVTDVSNRN